MQTNNELFSQIIEERKLGNRLPDDSIMRSNPLFEFHKSLAEVQIEKFRPFWDREGKFPNQAPILIDYLESTLAQASAFTHNNQHVITINCGIILLLEFMFNSLLCRKEFLEPMGNPQNERDDLPIIPMKTNYNTIFLALRTHGLAPSDFIPRDEERRNIARFLTYSAIRFMICHEFRHIQAGHTRYCKDKFKFNDILESISTCDAVDTAMQRQALEWDADRFAMHKLLEQHWIAQCNPHISKCQYGDMALHPKLMLFLCLTACSGLFRLLDGLTPPRSEWNTFSHPPSRNRRLILLTTALIWAELRDPLNFNNTTSDEMVAECVFHIEILLSKLWSCHYDKEYSTLVGQQARFHEQGIMRTWKAIMDELRKYSYVPLESCPL